MTPVMNTIFPAQFSTSVRLSLCMIVRDSTRTLSAALSSIQPYVDEMIVVDTGSTDNTADLAAKHGARVFHFPWCDDFAAARNESLRHANGEWIFWMDSDDTINSENGRRLRELANRAGEEKSVLGYVMQVHCPAGDGGGEDDVTVVDHVKMFRNDPVLRFEGRIHEQILPSIRCLGGEVAWTDIFVVHSGSDRSPEGKRRKYERDLRLLELDLDNRPNHPFVLFNLGMTYNDAGDHVRAVDHLVRCLKISGDGESHVNKAYALLVSSLSRLERQEEAWSTCREGLQRFPDDVELCFRGGVLAHHFGQLDVSVELYRKALAKKSERRFSSRDAGLAGHKARHNLALVYSERGEHGMAELQWRLALEGSPAFRLAARGLGETLLAQRRLATARVEAEQMAVHSDLRSDGAILKAKILIQTGRIDEARRELEEARNRFPNDKDILETQCRFLFEHEELDDAERSLQELCRLSPDDGAAFHNLATVQLRLGKHNQAVDSYRRSLAVRPSHSITECRLAAALQIKEGVEA